MFPLEARVAFYNEETSIMGLSDPEVLMIVAWAILHNTSLYQTYGRSGRRIYYK